MELAGVNARLLERLMPQLVERAPSAVFIIVTNPADVMTVVAQRASGLPVHRVFGSGTVLDTSRLRWRLAQRAVGALERIVGHDPHYDGAMSERHQAIMSRLPFGDGLTAELDLYDGPLEGHQLVEVEFDDDDAADSFQPPAWFGREVTDDNRYTNSSLARYGWPD